MTRKRFFTLLIFGIGLLFLLLVARGLMDMGPIGEKVAIVEVIGAISSSEEIIERLHQYRDDPSVKAIVLRIDSPGGSVAPVQEIYTEARKLKKPIVASLGSTAASGGYYIACSANHILANPGTLTGSIGVIMQFMKMKGLYEKVGIEQRVVKSGKFKDTGSLARDLTDEERALLQDTIDDVHNQFIDAILEGRKAHLTREEIVALADGRIFSGQQALAHQLVDGLGNLPDAIQMAATLGGISGKPKTIRAKRKVSLVERILGARGERNLDHLLNPGVSFRYELSF